MSTVDYYNSNAESFHEETKLLNLDELYTEFLKHLPAGGTILDAGCGSGRDIKYFMEHGYQATGIDASAELCRLASDFTKTTVLNISFEEIEFEDMFDGVWACASLLHIRRAELPGIFKKLEIALKKFGVVYCSFKLGDFEGDRNGRYFCDLTHDSLVEVLKNTEFKVLKNWITSDVRKGREGEQWLNTILSK